MYSSEVGYFVRIKIKYMHIGWTSGGNIWNQKSCDIFDGLYGNTRI